MAYVAMAYGAMADIVMAYGAMAYTGMANTVIAYGFMAYTVMTKRALTAMDNGDIQNASLTGYRHARYAKKPPRRKLSNGAHVARPNAHTHTHTHTHTYTQMHGYIFEGLAASAPVGLRVQAAEPR